MVDTLIALFEMPEALTPAGFVVLVIVGLVLIAIATATISAIMMALIKG